MLSLVNKRLHRICSPFRQSCNPHFLRSFCSKRITSRPRKWIPVLGKIITSYNQGAFILERCIQKIVSEVELVEKPSRTAELVSCALPRLQQILSMAKKENIVLHIDAACTQRIIQTLDNDKVVAFVREYIESMRFTAGSAMFCARFGRFDLLVLIHRISGGLTKTAIKEAAVNGNDSCLQFCLDNASCIAGVDKWFLKDIWRSAGKKRSAAGTSADASTF